jgi:hypothetical protein
MHPARDSLAVSSSQGQLPAGATVGGRFRVDGVLQQDAVSQTYRATDLGNHSSAALRIIPMRVLGTTAAQLEADIEKASALVHKNLIEVLNVGREADFFYIATELLDGQTLREFVDGRRREGRNVSFKGAQLVTHIANGPSGRQLPPHGGPPARPGQQGGAVKVAARAAANAPSLARRGAPRGPRSGHVAPGARRVPRRWRPTCSRWASSSRGADGSCRRLPCGPRASPRTARHPRRRGYLSARRRSRRAISNR